MAANRAVEDGVMTDPINDTTGADRVDPTKAKPANGGDLTARDTADVRRSVGSVSDRDVAGVGREVADGAGEADKYETADRDKTRSLPGASALPLAGAGSVATHDQWAAGAAIDRASGRLAGPTAGVGSATTGAPRTVYHFTNEGEARGIIRNGLRAGESGLAFNTTKARADAAGADAANAKLRLDINVKGGPDAVIPHKGNGSQPSWSGMGKDAEAQLRAEGNASPSKDQIEARRNAIAQEHMNGRPENSFEVKTGRGQSFDVRKPDALAGSEVTGLRGGDRVGALEADRRVGQLVAKEVLSGNANGARTAAAAVEGISPGMVDAFGKAATVAKYGGRVLVPLGAAMDIAAIAKSDDKLKTGTEKASAWAGAYVGAKGGVALGATAGAFVGGPVGAAVGGVVGGVVGGIAGYIGGEKVGGWAYDKVKSWFGW
jgi:hypothetical protein